MAYFEDDEIFNPDFDGDRSQMEDDDSGDFDLGDDEGFDDDDAEDDFSNFNI